MILTLRRRLLYGLLLLGNSTAWQPVLGAGNACLDPAIRHTNGMPIASSEPLRAHSVNWSCNPDHLGYCGGYYYRPCIDSIRCHRVRAAGRGCYATWNPIYNTYIGQVCPSGEGMANSIDGIEPVGMTPLGELPNDAVLPGLGVGAAVGGR